MSNNDRTNILRLGGNFFVIVGSLLLFPAIAFIILDCYLVNTASRVDGTVVRLLPGEKPSRSKKSAGFHPLIQFVPIGAKKAVEFPSSGLNYAVGDKVTVLYHADDSFLIRSALIDDPIALWYESVQIGIFGVIFTGIGVGIRKESMK
jgi:hypothetical protein